MKKYYFPILLGLLSLAGTCLLLVSTSRWGVNLGWDSPFYITMSHLFENYDKSPEMQLLCNIKLPLFPLVLSWGHWLGLGPLESARWLNAVLFGLNLLLIGVIVKRYSGSTSMGLLAAALLMLAPDIMGIHSMAQNEPLFIFFMLIWLLLFLDYLKNPRLPVIVLISVITALASLTRYAGIPMITTGLCAAMFLNRTTSFAGRSLQAAVLVAIPCLTLSLWNSFIHMNDNPVAINFAFHPADLSFFQEMVLVLYNWFCSPLIDIPLGEKTFLLVVMLCLFGLIFFNGNRARQADTDQNAFTGYSAFILIFIISYIIALIIMVSFYNTFKMNHSLQRFLIPVHIAGLILFCGFMSDFFRQYASSFQRDIGKIIIAYFLVFYALGAMKCLTDQYYFGTYYINPFRYSNIDPQRYAYSIRQIEIMPAGAPIYSNKPMDIYVLSNRDALLMPFTQNPRSLEQNGKYLSQLHQMAKDLRKNKGILVYFNNDDQFIEPLKTLRQKIPLHPIAQDKYASVFTVP